MFECVVCGICTKDALVDSIADARRGVALCGSSHCRRVFRGESWKYVPSDAETGGGD